MKLTYEDKISIYNKRKLGVTTSELSKIFNISVHSIKYLIRLGDYHGTDIFKKGKKRKYSEDFKLVQINKILNNEESVSQLSVKLALVSHGILCNWIKSFKENGYNVVSKKRGRPTTTTMKPKAKDNKELTDKERIKILEEKLKYLEMENEYLKKLKVLVQKDKKR